MLITGKQSVVDAFYDTNKRLAVAVAAGANRNALAATASILRTIFSLRQLCVRLS